MAYWAWVKGLETGLEEIDNQHKRLVDYINMLDEAIKSLDTSKLEQVLNALIDYTVIHFSFEEKLMKKGGYEYADEHRVIHESFKVQVVRMKKRIEQQDAKPDELMEMLVRWLVKHIKDEDKGYVDAVRPVLENRSWLSKTLDSMFGKQLQDEV